MKPFSELSAEELAMENLFIRWVRFPDDPPIRSFWEGWIVKYPAMKDTVAKARELVLMASDWKPDSLSSQEVNSIWGRIRNSLDIITERDPGQPGAPSFQKTVTPNSIVLGVISMAVIILLAFFFFSIIN
ncbi:hypothetical protein [Dyadobacter fanqingshengii]|uniref:Uncharacterized protein n=1 Tax=Dyadobacter fanqingshengii TaxID=2906443 RepID=A0A9X1T8R7_9BACT|nr:hypothetical protein [Dyadobacter fanqingshengii]MCF0039966.1 hypothetical protein [Dyadobacter fanqingshengii]MCF2502524.1 hypothetical protein [Dyadobacter fanqingshengii]USJ38278.1 hypothetical protein NFI81_10935 [Dyadobacter fanqingshengii]